MKYLLSLLICLILIPLMAQSPLPISSYDYAIPEKNVSPIAMGSAALNLTNAQDPFAAYSNPALLAYNEHSHFFFSFRLSDTDELNFWEVASISNALKDKQFKYFTAVAGKVGFAYQPVSSINISAIDIDSHKSLYYDYNLDKVQLSLGITDKNWPHMALGLNLKYLSGRLVFLEEQIIGSNLLRIHFIDDKVKGFSSDLGYTYQTGNTTFAITGYDLLSGLYWENYPNRSIQRRIASAAEYSSSSSKTSIGIQSKIAKSPETTYHLAYTNGVSWDAKSYAEAANIGQGIDFRVGMYSHDFYGADNINVTLGGGYYYQLFRFDFSVNTRGLKLSESELLFSLGMGF